MNYKKGLLAFCLIICVLFCISSVAAGDVNDTAIASDDTTANEEPLTTEENSDDALAINKNSAEVLNADQNDAKDKSVLTVKNTDEDAVSYVESYAKVKIYKQTGKYANDKKIYVKLTDSETGEGIRESSFGLELTIYDYKTGKEVDTYTWLTTNSDGIGVLEWSDTLAGDGVFKIKVTDFISQDADYTLLQNSGNTAKVNVAKNKVTISAKELTVPKKSKKKFAIKVIGQDKKPVNGACLVVKVYTKNKAKSYHLWTNKKGVANFDKVSKLSGGKHKVKIGLAYYDSSTNYAGSWGLYGKSISSSITVGKAPVTKKSITIKAKKMSAKYKSGKKFKVKIIDSKSKKPVKGIKVTLKVDKKKAVTLKTNKKGIVSYSTKKLKAGNHKVVLNVKATSKFKKASKKTSIKITKAKAKKKSSSKSKSKSNSNTQKGKLRTTLTINSCYRPDYTQYYFKVTLKDSKGHKLANKQIQIATYISIGSSGMTVHHVATTDSNGVAEGYVRPIANGAVTYDATFKFAGDKSYYSSSAHKYVG